MDLAQKPRPDSEIQQEVAELDNSMLIVAIASGVCVMVLCIISCICCYRHGRRSSDDERSDSRRDTVPLEDLLSKPSLADPESVFSEASYDGRLSIHTSSWAGLASDNGSTVQESMNDHGLDTAGPDGTNLSSTAVLSKADAHVTISALKKGKSQSQKVIKANRELRNQDREYLSQRHSTKTGQVEMLDTANNKLKRAEAVADSLPKKCTGADNEDKPSPDTARKLKLSAEQADQLGIDPTGLKIHRDSITPEKQTFLSSTRCSFSHEVGHMALGNKVPRTSLPRTEECDDTGGKTSAPNTPEQRRAAADVTCQVNTTQTPTSCSSTVTINSNSTTEALNPTDKKSTDKVHTESAEKLPKVANTEMHPEKHSNVGRETPQKFNAHSKTSFSPRPNASIQANITHSSELIEDAEQGRVPLRRYSSIPQGCGNHQDFIGHPRRKTFSLNLKIDFHFDQEKEGGESVAMLTCSPTSECCKHGKDSPPNSVYTKGTNRTVQTQALNNSKSAERLEEHSKQKLLEQSFASKSGKLSTEPRAVMPKRLSEPASLKLSSSEATTTGGTKRRNSVAESPPAPPRKLPPGAASAPCCESLRQKGETDRLANKSQPTGPCDKPCESPDQSQNSVATVKPASDSGSVPVEGVSTSESHTESQDNDATPRVETTPVKSSDHKVDDVIRDKHPSTKGEKNENINNVQKDEQDSCVTAGAAEKATNIKSSREDKPSVAGSTSVTEKNKSEICQTNETNASPVGPGQEKSGDVTGSSKSDAQSTEKSSTTGTETKEKISPGIEAGSVQEPVAIQKSGTSPERAVETQSTDAVPSASRESTVTNRNSSDRKDFDATAQVKNDDDMRKKEGVRATPCTAMEVMAEESIVENVGDKDVLVENARRSREPALQTAETTPCPETSLETGANVGHESPPLKTESKEIDDTQVAHLAGQRMKDKTLVTSLNEQTNENTAVGGTSVNNEFNVATAADQNLLSKDVTKATNAEIKQKTEGDRRKAVMLEHPRRTKSLQEKDSGVIYENRDRKYLPPKPPVSRATKPTSMMSPTAGDGTKASGVHNLPVKGGSGGTAMEKHKAEIKGSKIPQRKVEATQKSVAVTHTSPSFGSQEKQLKEKINKTLDAATDDKNDDHGNVSHPGDNEGQERKGRGEKDPKCTERNNNNESNLNKSRGDQAESFPSKSDPRAEKDLPEIVFSKDGDEYRKFEDSEVVRGKHTKTSEPDDGSDESDYDNPWDDLDETVKRASIRYNRRPSRIAAGDKAILLKSAEDLGRLMEEAEKRRQLRQASARNSCQVVSPTENMTIPFTRFSPLRHTVKGIVSEPHMTTSKSSENILNTQKAEFPKLSLLRSEEAGDNSRGIDARRPKSLTAEAKTKMKVSPETKKRKK